MEETTILFEDPAPSELAENDVRSSAFTAPNTTTTLVGKVCSSAQRT